MTDLIQYFILSALLKSWVVMMGGIRGAIKIIDKTPEEIEKIKADVKKAGPPEETITVVIYGLNLILWLPKLILEQKITLSRLKDLLFGRGKRRQKSKSKDGNDDSEPAPEENNKSNSINSAANDEVLSDDADEGLEPPSLDKTTSGNRSGQNPHTAYQNAVEHSITIEDLETGHPCPLDCGGKL